MSSSKAKLSANGVLLLLTLWRCGGGCSAERIPGGFGPFRIELRSQSVCPGSEKCLQPQKIDVSNLHFEKDSSAQYRYSYNADINSTIPIQDSYKVDLRVSKWNSLSNGWTNNVFRMTVQNPCTAFKSHRPDIFKQVSEAVYEGTLTDCPLPAVKTKIRDFSVETKPPDNLKQLPYGRFRARMKLIHPTQECVLCTEVVTDILPKH